MQVDHKYKLDIFSELIEHSTDAVIIWSRGGGIVFWNRGAQRLYGYSEEEALGFSGKRFLKPEFSTAEADVYRALDDKGSWEGDIREVTKHGEPVIVAARFQSLKLEGHDVVMTINRDVTQERQQLQRISTQARLLELCPDAIIEIIDGTGVAFWNQGAERLYGYTGAEVTGQKLDTLLKSQYSQPFDQIVDILKRDGEWQGDVLEQKKSGEIITVSSSIQFYSHDGVDSYLIINRDVTRQRLMQSDLVAVNKALVTSNRELDEFAYIATHDLKEPFRGIAINADILLRENLPEKAEARVRRMSVLCQRIDLLLSDLLYFSRLANPEKTGVEIDLVETIESVKSELAKSADSPLGLITIDTELPCVVADPIKIHKLFYNLISNGLAYNDAETKKVNIGYLSNVNDDGVEMQNAFYVRDNGIGIAEKNKIKIFQFFKRLNREEDYGFGTGAGLTILKKIIERYDGEIRLISQPQFGTTFFFTLPVDQSAIAQ